MFTFKKLALVGAAGLTAFSMSCSDPDEKSEPSGQFVGLTVTNPGGFAMVTGGITTSEASITVKSVKATADGKDVNFAPPAPVVDVAAVALAHELIGICAATATTTSKSFDIKIIVTFSDDTKLESANMPVTVDCSTAAADPALIKKNLTLSEAGTSYADLDAAGGGQTYGQTAAATIKNKIDLIAYNTQVGEDEDGDPLPYDMIYAPVELDFFYDASGFLGSKVVAFFPLPNSTFNTLNSATKLSELDPLESVIEDAITDDNFTTYVPTAKNTAFLAVTSEEDLKIVLITNTGTKTVDLNAITVPDDE
jgi:hypothetical protein